MLGTFRSHGTAWVHNYSETMPISEVMYMG
jgi:hypothetical protein